MNTRQYTAKLLLDIFGNTRYAKARISDDVSYYPVSGELSEEALISHLRGEIVLGSYALSETNSVWWMGWDVDAIDMEIAREYATTITDRLGDIPHCIEFSGGKGYHILIFLTAPMQASLAKQITDMVRESLGLPKVGKNHVECYPKQSKLSHNNPLGNLLKIPLGKHPRTHARSIFVDPDNGWEGGEPLNPIEVLENKATHEEVKRLLEAENRDAVQAIVQAIAPAWVSGERHSLALNLSGYLCQIGWGLQQACDLIEDICNKAGDDEIRNRLQSVEDTYKKYASGGSVRGYSYLSEALPGGVMTILDQNARMVATPALMKKLEGIRLGKGAGFVKVKDTADIMWTDLTDKGTMLKTRTNQLFWYSQKSHLLTDMSTELWLAHIHKEFGINPAEAYGKQVLKSLELRTISDGRVTDVHKRSYWDGSRLFVNLGGEEVYILDGQDIEMQYNGDCGVIFVTNPDTSAVPIPDRETELDAWEFLTDDISFATTEEAAALPEEQRELLRAWIIAFFFPQLMETKPILCALGSPGSGKTSTMRRIIRILEGVKQDVTSFAEDKPDSVRASIENHKLVVLDNLEQSKAQWLVNLLNTLSTGAAIELRTFYKTNEVYRIEPEVFIAITAVDLPFSESTLHSRLIPIEMAPIKNIKPETTLQKVIRQNQEGIWGSLLLKLNKVVASLLKFKPKSTPVQSRLADFAMLCAFLMRTDVIEADNLRRGLFSLLDRQRTQMLRSSPVVEVLEDFIQTVPKDAEKWMTYSDLMAYINSIAFKRRIPLQRVSTAAALKRHLEPRMSALERVYGAETRRQKDRKGREQELIRFTRQVNIEFDVKEA